jgi:hypothetical protein
MVRMHTRMGDTIERYGYLPTLAESFPATSFDSRCLHLEVDKRKMAGHRTIPRTKTEKRKRFLMKNLQVLFNTWRYGKPSSDECL